MRPCIHVDAEQQEQQLIEFPLLLLTARLSVNTHAHACQAQQAAEECKRMMQEESKRMVQDQNSHAHTLDDHVRELYERARRHAQDSQW